MPNWVPAPNNMGSSVSDPPKVVPVGITQLGGASAHFYSGIGAPPASLGVPGDLYFRQDNGATVFIYGKLTTTGAWQQLV